MQRSLLWQKPCRTTQHYDPCLCQAAMWEKQHGAHLLGLYSPMQHCRNFIGLPVTMWETVLEDFMVCGRPQLSSCKKMCHCKISTFQAVRLAFFQFRLSKATGHLHLSLFTLRSFDFTVEMIPSFCWHKLCK